MDYLVKEGVYFVWGYSFFLVLKGDVIAKT